MAADAGAAAAAPERVNVSPESNARRLTADGRVMTAKHRSAKPSPIADRLAKGTTPVLAAHLAVVVHADGSLSWHVGRMDPASHRMTFPYAGVTDAPVSRHPSVVDCLAIACNEAIGLATLMGS